MSIATQPETNQGPFHESCLPTQWDASNDDYHAETEHESSTTLRRFLASPLAFWHERVRRDRPRSRPNGGMLLGSAVDIALLEPDKYRELVRFAPDATGYKTYEAEKFRAMAADMPPGGVLLTAADGAKVEPMLAGVRANPKAWELVNTPGSNQLSLRWTDEASGVRLKVRYDRLFDSGDFFDLKTASDPYPLAFARKAHDFGYHVQAALYAHARDLWLSVPQGEGKQYYIVVGNEWPFECMVHQLCKRSLAEGHDLWRYAVAEIARHSTGRGRERPWLSDYQNAVNTISLPSYAFNREYLR